MVRSFVMAKTTAGDIESIVATVVDLPGVREAHVVAGDYDVIIEVESADVADAIRTVSTDLRDVEGIIDTRTYIALE